MFKRLEINENKEKEFNFSNFEKKCFVNIDEAIKPPETLISIGEHEYKGKFYPTSVLTAGEFSSIVATSKSKKSFLKSALIGCYIGGESQNLFPNIKSHRTQDVTILDFDTEMGEYYTQRAFRRVHEMVGGIYKHYHGYATRNLTSKERLKFIDECLKNQKTTYKHPVKLVSIDGIADMVDNTNDIVMSKEAADYLLKWTHDYNIHIITVIHKSGTTGKPLGHLGTYVMKKSESILNLDVQSNGDVLVTNPLSRGYQFDEFSFNINTSALPYLIQ